VLAALDLLKITEHLLAQGREKRLAKARPSAKPSRYTGLHPRSIGKRRIFVEDEIKDQTWKEAWDKLKPALSNKNRKKWLEGLLSRVQDKYAEVINRFEEEYEELPAKEVVDELLKQKKMKLLSPSPTSIISSAQFQVLWQLKLRFPDLRKKKLPKEIDTPKS
jgi:hypothetical protein